MVLLDDLSNKLQASDPEERWIISGVSWQQYQVLLDDLGDSPAYRVTYLEGVLEIMAPSRRHERHKTLIGSLLEDYFKEKRILYFPLGSTTFRKQEKKGGTEPDESYCFDEEKEFPDLAIEVVVTSGSVDKLAVYQRLGVKEVWFFRDNRFEVYHLQPGAYQEIPKSELFPNLDLAMLAEYVLHPNPLLAALEFREKISHEG